MAYLPRSSSAHLVDFMALSSGKDLISYFTMGISWYTTTRAIFFTSPYELERHAYDALRAGLSLPVYSVGPLIPSTALNTKTLSPFAYSDWLDSQSPSSVLFVSFGSFLPIAPQQMEEIVFGLNMSGVRFLFVAREESDHLQELVAKKNLVVPWADQAETLCHASVGGFLTHCGWNSTVEGAYAGVPMLAFPLMWDQFSNSKLIIDDWKIGLRLKDDGFVTREEIATVVRRLMDLESGEGKEMRRRATELKEMSRQALEEKGSSTDCIDAFVRDIRQFKDLNN